MGTYRFSNVGDRFETPAMTVTAELMDTLIERGGYVHPLFVDPEWAANSPIGRRPLPGPAVLLLMGGLAEQTGRFDGTVIALVGFEDVRFRAPAFEGDEIHADVEVLGKEGSDGRGLLTMLWRMLRADGTVLCEARARMLFRAD